LTPHHHYRLIDLVTTLTFDR